MKQIIINEIFDAHWTNFIETLSTDQRDLLPLDMIVEELNFFCRQWIETQDTKTLAQIIAREIKTPLLVQRIFNEMLNENPGYFLRAGISLESICNYTHNAS